MRWIFLGFWMCWILGVRMYFCVCWCSGIRRMMRSCWNGWCCRSFWFMIVCVWLLWRILGWMGGCCRKRLMCVIWVMRIVSRLFLSCCVLWRRIMNVFFLSFGSVLIGWVLFFLKLRCVLSILMLRWMCMLEVGCCLFCLIFFWFLLRLVFLLLLLFWVFCVSFFNIVKIFS